VILTSYFLVVFYCRGHKRHRIVFKLDVNSLRYVQNQTKLNIKFEDDAMLFMPPCVSWGLITSTINFFLPENDFRLHVDGRPSDQLQTFYISLFWS